MICAAESLPSISWMRPSIKPWRSLAASYSAFSLRSPWARASEMELMTQGRSTVFSLMQLGLQALCAALGNRDGCHVEKKQWVGANTATSHLKRRRYEVQQFQLNKFARCKLGLYELTGLCQTRPRGSLRPAVGHGALAPSITGRLSRYFMPSTAASAPAMVV